VQGRFRNRAQTQMKILITGATGSLGMELLKSLKLRLPREQLLTPSRSELDLSNPLKVERYLEYTKPTHVYHLAGTVYGIHGNKVHPEKAMLENSLIDFSLFSGLFKFPPKWIFYASTVATYGFPFQEKTLRETDWLRGDPHESEFGYAMAKRHARSYLEVISKDFGTEFSYGLLTNLFGDGDRFLNGKGHVIVSLLHKGAEAAQSSKALEVWGSEESSRDFLATEDAAEILVDLFGIHTSVVNVASGQEVFISEIGNQIVSKYRISNGYRFTGENSGIPSRVCSIDQIRKYTRRLDQIDSRKKIQNFILNY
jgi:GDP-L-fucose synthase